MSLQIWLPLNGSLENKGLVNTTINQVGSSLTYSNGKIGQALIFPNNPANYIYFTGLQLQIFTWTLWFKCTGAGASSSQWIMSEGRDYSTNNAHGTYIRINQAGTSLLMSSHEVTNNGITIELNKWYHAAMTADGTNMKFYLNGELKQTLAYTMDANYTESYGVCALGKMSHGYTSTTSYFPFNGQINDVRIYDNALSETEIKEIAKGLVLHLPLNNNGLGNENLLRNSNFYTGTTAHWGPVNSSTVTVESKDGYLCGTGTKGTSNNILYQNNGSYTGNESVDITVSAKVYVNSTGTFTVGNWVSTTSVSGWRSLSGTRVWNTSNNLKVGWNYVSTTLKNATNQYTGNIITAFGYSGTTFWITDVKLEKGIKATPWSPNTLDEIYPDYGPGVPQNLLSGTPKGSAPTSYCFSQLNLLENLQAGKTYTLQLWNVNVSHSAKTAEQTGVWVYWGGGSVQLFNWAGSTYFTDGHADYLSKTFTVTESQATGNGSVNKWLNLYNSVPSVSGTLSASIEKWKLEESSTASDYTPAITDTAYKEEGYNNRAIFDQSGYCHNAMCNNITYSSDTPKYNVSSTFTSSSTSYIKILDNSWMAQGATDMTINLWGYQSSWASFPKFFSCTESGGWNVESGNTGYTRFPIYVFTDSAKTTKAYKYSSNELKHSDLTAGWHMFTFIYNSTGNKVYVDGQLHSSYAFTSYGISYNTSARLFLGCEAAAAKPSSPYFNGKISDFRIYYTTLSEKDILSLYNNNAYIDSNNNIHGEIRA